MSKRKKFEDLSRSQQFKRLAQHRNEVLQECEKESSSSSDSSEATFVSEVATRERHEPQGSRSSTASDSPNPCGSPTCSSPSVSQSISPSLNKPPSPSSPSSSSQSPSNSPSSSSTEESDDERTFQEELSDFVVRSKLSRSNCDKLLKLIRRLPNQRHIPKSRKGLIKDRVGRVQLKKVDPGFYYHFSIKQGLITALQETYLKEENIEKICLSVNMDGVEVSKSGVNSLFTILGHASNLPGSEVFKIGLYQGSTKPESLELFLEEFVSEITNLIENGFEYNGKTFDVKFHCLICDIPAKSFVLNTKGHAGLFCCTKCEVSGRRLENRTCFDEVDCRLRTDTSFREKSNAEHHNGDSPLTRIPGMDMIKDVVYDPFHLVYVGILLKLLRLLFTKSHHRLNLRLRQSVSSTLDILSKFIPWEFSRRCRDLKALEKFKGTELRLILLYIGPVVLEKICDGSIEKRDKYINFLTLHVACTMLSSRASEEEIDYCEDLLKNFIHGFSTLYGEEHVSINVHALCHLCDDVRRFGPIDRFSAFPYENENGKIRSEIKPGVLALKQLVKRDEEKKLYCIVKKKKAPSVNIEFTGVLLNGDTLPGFGQPFSKYAVHCDWKIGTRIPNNCIMTKNHQIFLVQTIAHSIEERRPMFIAREYTDATDLYTLPRHSSSLYIYQASALSHLKIVDPRDVFAKCLRVPYKEQFAIFPLLHCKCE